MRTCTLIAWFAAVVLTNSVALAEPNHDFRTQMPAASDVKSARASLRDALQNLREKNYEAAREALQLVVSSNQFENLSPQEQFGAEFALGFAYEKLQDNESAAKYLRLATSSLYATKEAWSLRLLAASRLSRLDDEVDCLTRIAQTWPELLHQDGDRFVLAVVQRASTAPSVHPGYVALLNALFAAQWKPTDPFLTPDSVWRDLVDVRIGAGDLSGATIAASLIESAYSIIEMRIDKRFDPVTQADPSRFDIGKAFARDSAKTRAAAAAAPDSLEGVNESALDLISSGKPAEALTLLDDAIARTRSTDAGKRPFGDYDDWINWIENNRAMALKHLGRFDESLSQLARAAARVEDGTANVSQAINLGDAYNAVGRPRDALASVAPVSLGKPSPFGLMQAEGVRACAFAQLNDGVELQKSLDYLKAHGGDAAGAYAWALLCANDLDGAAKEYMASLENPDSRGRVLYEFQDFVEPANRPPFAAEVHKRFLAVRNRADVRAAIEKYGRIISLPFVEIG